MLVTGLSDSVKELLPRRQKVPASRYGTGFTKAEVVVVLEACEEQQKVHESIGSVGDWDLSVYFASFRGQDYRETWSALQTKLPSLLGRSENITQPQDCASLISEWEVLGQDFQRFQSYLGCLRAADGRLQEVAKDYAALQGLGAEFRKFEVNLLAYLRGLTDQQFHELTSLPQLKDAHYRLMVFRQTARWQMNPDQEKLAADLDVDGLSAWGRLYDQISGRLEFDMPDPDSPGKNKKVPMSLKRSLTESPDPQIRQVAFENSNLAWATMEDVCAACLNAIAGSRLTLYKRRGVEHFLDVPLLESAITKKTLDAMLQAVADRIEVPRRFFRRKAKALGKEKLGFFDMYCPLPQGDATSWSWQSAWDSLERAYRPTYPEFADFCQMAHQQRWVDYQAREGKRGGGFCTSPLHQGQSRIFMTFNSTTGDVQTLAHELGHAYHNWIIRQERPMNLAYPMTLAETASTLAETLLLDAQLSDPNLGAGTKIALLNTQLENAAAFLLNIPMRFDFERGFYQERAEGELTVDRIKELTLQAQHKWFGDTVHPDQFDPYFWASKLHFYITEISFYNFPYTFGFLFSLGLFAVAKQRGSAFWKDYEELLRRTGADSAENLAREILKIDLESVKFWNGSIDILEKQLDDFEALLA